MFVVLPQPNLSSSGARMKRAHLLLEGDAGVDSPAAAGAAGAAVGSPSRDMTLRWFSLRAVSSHATAVFRAAGDRLSDPCCMTFMSKMKVHRHNCVLKKWCNKRDSLRAISSQPTAVVRAAGNLLLDPCFFMSVSTLKLHTYALGVQHGLRKKANKVSVQGIALTKSAQQKLLLNKHQASQQR